VGVTLLQDSNSQLRIVQFHLTLYNFVGSYLIIQKCWNEDPKGRPDFSKLVDTISLTLEAAPGYMDFSLRIKGELPVATEVEVKTMAGDSNMQSPNELEGGREQETAM